MGPSQILMENAIIRLLLLLLRFGQIAGDIIIQIKHLNTKKYV